VRVSPRPRRLVGLFDTAEAAGVPDVIVAQDRTPVEVPMPSYALTSVRVSAEKPSPTEAITQS
jgi:hypothetical protein